MKKRKIIAAAAFLLGGATLVEVQTGWLFGSEASAAAAGGGGAALIPLPSALAGGALGHSGAASGPAPGAAPRAASSPSSAADQQQTEQPGGDAGGAQVSDSGAEMPGSPGGQMLVLGMGGRAGASAFASPSPISDDSFGGGFGGSGGSAAGKALASSPSAVDSISGVPEPASWISLVAGLMLVGVNVRNRRSARSVAS